MRIRRWRNDTHYNLKECDITVLGHDIDLKGELPKILGRFIKEVAMHRWWCILIPKFVYNLAWKLYLTTETYEME